VYSKIALLILIISAFSSSMFIMRPTLLSLRSFFAAYKAFLYVCLISSISQRTSASLAF
jgi:hypothetical protein